MSRRRSIALLVLVAALGSACSRSAEHPFPGDPSGFYSSKPPARGGIGKVYMGREIAEPLGRSGIAWLERAERETAERPDLLLDDLDLAPDSVIADIGAGSGYLTLRIAERVPDGRVLAVDILPEWLRLIERRCAERGVENVDTVLGAVDDPRLPAGQVDAVLIVDAYHEFAHPREMIEGTLRGLIPGGRVFVVEYRAEEPDLAFPPLHRMSESQVRREIEAAGLAFVENRGMLPQQHLLVFEKPAEN